MITSKLKNFILFLFISLIIIYFDIWSKHYFQNLLEFQSIVIWKDIKLILQTNFGIAFSIPIKGVLQILLSITLLIGMIVYAHIYYKWKLKKTTV